MYKPIAIIILSLLFLFSCSKSGIQEVKNQVVTNSGNQQIVSSNTGNTDNSVVQELKSEDLGNGEYKITGKLKEPVKEISVIWTYSGKTDEPYKLKKYQSGSLGFEYNVGYSKGNISFGENKYDFSVVLNNGSTINKTMQINGINSNNDTISLLNNFSSKKLTEESLFSSGITLVKEYNGKIFFFQDYWYEVDKRYSRELLRQPKIYDIKSNKIYFPVGYKEYDYFSFKNLDFGLNENDNKKLLSMIGNKINEAFYPGCLNSDGLCEQDFISIEGTDQILFISDLLLYSLKDDSFSNLGNKLNISSTNFVINDGILFYYKDNTLLGYNFLNKEIIDYGKIKLGVSNNEQSILNELNSINFSPDKKWISLIIEKDLPDIGEYGEGIWPIERNIVIFQNSKKGLENKKEFKTGKFPVGRDCGINSWGNKQIIWNSSSDISLEVLNCGVGDKHLGNIDILKNKITINQKYIENRIKR